MIDEQLTPQGATSAGARNTILLFVGIAIVAAISAAVAILLPRARTVGDRSKAALAPICADSFYVAAAPTPVPGVCNSPCVLNGTTPQCGLGMTCVNIGGTGYCRNPQNPSSTTCTPLGSPTPTPRPSPTTLPSPTPVVVCVPPPRVDDPPTVACAPSATTKGTITWEWIPAPTANRYWIDILNNAGTVVTGLPGTGAWRTDTDFNCQSGMCKLTTQLLPGTYQSRIRGHASAGSGEPLCTNASWSYSQKMTLGVCTTTDPNACVNKAESIVLVIDRSDSMNTMENGKTKLQWAKDAAVAFVNQVSSGQSSGLVKIGVVTFGQKNAGTTIYNTVTVSGLTSDYTTLKTKIAGIARSDSGTCIGCALKVANTMVQSATQGRYVVLFSDGAATFSSTGVRDNTTAEKDAIAQADTGRKSAITYYGFQWGSLDSSTGQIYRSPRGTTVMNGVAGDPGRVVYSPTVQQVSSQVSTITSKICSAN